MGIELTLRDLMCSQNIYYKSLMRLSEMIDIGPFCSKIQAFIFFGWEKSQGPPSRNQTFPSLYVSLIYRWLILTPNSSVHSGVWET